MQHKHRLDMMLYNITTFKHVLKSQYSGMLSVEIAAKNLEKALQEQDIIPKDAASVFEMLEACDNNPLCQKLLLGMPAGLRPLHYFDDIFERLPRHVRRQVEEVPWPGRERFAKDPMAAMQEAATGMTKVNEILADDQVWPNTSKSWCLRHKTHCLVNSRAAFDDDTQRTYCWAGIVCLADTKMGMQEGYCGEHTKTMLVWASERSRAKESVVVTECAPDWDPTPVRSALSATHTMHHMTICPSIWGWPIRRLRAFTVNTKNDRVQMSASFQDFCEEMGWFRAVMTPGTDLYVEDPIVVQAELIDRCRARGVLEHEAAWEASLSGAQCVYLQEWRRKLGTASPWVADLDHTPETKRMSKPQDARSMIPCLLRHGTVWRQMPEGSSLESRVMLKREFLSCQGIHCIPHAHGSDFTAPWAGMLPKLSTHQVNMLTGNGVHLEVVSALWCWVLCCGQPVRGPQKPSRRCPVVEVVDVSDEEDVAMEDNARPLGKRLRATDHD